MGFHSVEALNEGEFGRVFVHLLKGGFVFGNAG